MLLLRRRIVLLRMLGMVFREGGGWGRCTSYGCCREFGSEQANVVTWSNLAQSHENASQDDKASNSRRLIELAVGGCHREADDTLKRHAAGNTPFGPNPVCQESTKESTRQPETVDGCSHAEILPQGMLGREDEDKPGGGEYAERIG
jgi:hypothetical protein